jgi:molybdopterin/thiamine biosynthesis adenylyltransferase
MGFSQDEVERYARHLVLREIGGPGQQKLKAASVLIVGAGGLGAPAALYLAAAGVGRIGIIDADTVSLSNLQRQVLYDVADVGTAKTAAARARLAGLNPHVTIEVWPEAITADNAAARIAGFDLVLDGCDNFETRLLVSDACLAAGVPLVSGAIGRWTGQVGVFAGAPC